MANENSDRIEQALSVLDLPLVIWRRVSGETTALPPLIRDEEPSDVFVDIVAVARRAENRFVTDSMAFASAEALRRYWREAYSEERIGPLGELIYLCARIEAIQAIEELTGLLREAPEPMLQAEVLRGESLRQRALRSFIGLLGAEQQREIFRERVEQEEVLERLRRVPDCEVLAIAGLMGLQPDRFSFLFETLPKPLQREAQINMSIAGFRLPSVAG